MDLGAILRQEREDRQVSQLDLALRLNISQRHLSFVETGKARPSRELILNWLLELNSSPSVRNAALLRAGFSSARVSPSRHHADGPQPTVAHERVLSAHDPWPGLTFSSDWRMLRVNSGADWLFNVIMPGYLNSLGPKRGAWDMIEGIAHEGGLLSLMFEPWVVGGRLLRQLRLEMLVQPSLSPRVASLEKVMTAKYGKRLTTQSMEPLEPGLHLRFGTPMGDLTFFTVQTVFQLPQDVEPASLRTGLWFPGDQATQHVLRANVPLLTRQP